MGQSRRIQTDSKVLKSIIRKFSAFQTSLGWWGIVGREELVCRSYCGYPTQSRLLDQVRSEFGFCGGIQEADWYPELRERLQQFARGVNDPFEDIRLDLTEETRFQLSVLTRTREISAGETITYGELAAKAGYPRASRAVGTVMSRNRYPILIPCHRVVSTGGKLGGYTNPEGVRFKSQLLAMEAEMAESIPFASSRPLATPPSGNRRITRTAPGRRHEPVSSPSDARENRSRIPPR